MDNPKKDLVEAIVELREDVERQLKANKYYIALNKLDELLAAIKPLEGIEGTAEASESAMPAPEPGMAEAKDESEKTWSGIVKENVGQSTWQSRAPEAP